jgi:hypothetical protein
MVYPLVYIKLTIVINISWGIVYCLVLYVFRCDC